jgi:dihydrodipicolinate synthase/N-acetylneuraminate lyase
LIIIYNVPEELQVICCRKQLRLANDFQNIVAVEAAGDMVQAMQIVKDKPKDFLVISGDDDCFANGSCWRCRGHIRYRAGFSKRVL